MADLKEDPKDHKEVPEAPPPEDPKAKVVELILRPLVDGHTIQLNAKTAGADGAVIDHMVVSDATSKELRLELENLQEVVVRPKVTHVGTYDDAQFAGISTPIDQLKPETKKKYEHTPAAESPTPAVEPRPPAGKPHAGATHPSGAHR